jgi:hypothetical protein
VAGHEGKMGASAAKSNAFCVTKEIECPKCCERFIYAGPHQIDACGFESYSFDCKVCGSSLAGILDPYDETLLLIVLEGRQRERRALRKRRKIHDTVLEEN